MHVLRPGPDQSDPRIDFCAGLNCLVEHSKRVHIVKWEGRHGDAWNVEVENGPNNSITNVYELFYAIRRHNKLKIT